LAKPEVLDLVDIDDRPVGKATLKECLEKGLLHRAVAVLVLRQGGRLLLQRRSKKDRWHPGRWTLSSTGHVKAGESYARAGTRECHEELGLDLRLRPVAKLLLPRIRSRGLTEWELVTLFTAASDEEARPDRQELEEVEDLSPSEVRDMMKSRKLTPDAKILLKKYFSSVGDDPGARASVQGLGRLGQ
jgi:isopentenyldiphosphate isomerase